MNTDITPGNRTKTITVLINERSVEFSERQVNGLTIKRTAIQQGVSIQEDFILFWVRGEAPLKQIADGDSVNLHEGQVFRVVTADDNS